ncbi:MAG: hypothetical protein Q8K59_01215 [Nitrosomonas sp.]|nr:hypothetical protein [Nitrosomonas sp.]MDP1949720.1 hypothetical protein [Nitrosomonas sp.]
MPDNLSNAHAQLDKAVDAAYGYKRGKDDATRVAFLFKLYQALTTGLLSSATTQAESTATITVPKAPKKPTRKPKNV